MPLRQVVRKLGGRQCSSVGRRKFLELLQNESEEGRGGPRGGAPEIFCNIYTFTACGMPIYVS